MQGHFSDNALALYAELIRDLENPDFAEERSESYDFTRCVRANGTVYGTGGKCRKGKEVASDKKAKQADMRARMAAAASRLEGADPALKPTDIKKTKIASQKEGKAKLREKTLRAIETHKNTKPEALSENILTLANLIKNEPGFKTPLTTSTLIALRALRMKSHLNKKEEKRKATQAIAKNSDELVAKSPKYKSTPGSSKPLPKATKEGILKELNKELEIKKGELEKALPMNMQSLKITILALERDISNAERGEISRIVNSPLNLIYEKQGFNAKPEVVAKRSDLESRSDIARNPDGRAIIAYRGVTSEEFSTQFKGGGSNGEVHFPGQGIYGNGSYAASSPLKGDTKHDKWAQETAVSYSGEKTGKVNLKVTAFAFRSDARLVQFEEKGKTFPQWEKETLAKAEKVVGQPFYDVGAAAAALGIHAYRIPQMGQDYWVVLNRGAIIIANDPELPPE